MFINVDEFSICGQYIGFWALVYRRLNWNRRSKWGYMMRNMFGIIDSNQIEEQSKAIWCIICLVEHTQLNWTSRTIIYSTGQWSFKSTLLINLTSAGIRTGCFPIIFPCKKYIYLMLTSWCGFFGMFYGSKYIIWWSTWVAMDSECVHIDLTRPLQLDCVYMTEVLEG